MMENQALSDAKNTENVADITNKTWHNATNLGIQSAVSLHYFHPVAFDGGNISHGQATGFVVDADRGYILTNRHIITPGPFWGYCVFNNHEECPVHAVYRDPVHDFGILRFDPSLVKYLSLASLSLRPDLARVGTEIRLLGNNDGHQLSISQSVIGRIDRNAPIYYDSLYSDFNTSYIQSSTATSGGSSGSPVIDVDGNAVALQASGSEESSADFMLPLDRPLRVLKLIQEGKPVMRGTIQISWQLKPYDWCRRLGLSADMEALFRSSFPEASNLIVARTVLPDGPADGKICVGDVILKVNGELLLSFVQLDEVLDSSVAKTVTILVQRGAQEVETTINVEDLHAITPNRYLSVAGGIFHDLSYIAASLYAISLKSPGVYVASSTKSFAINRKKSAVIKQLDGQDTPNLDAFIKIQSQIPDGKRVLIGYKYLGDQHNFRTTWATMDKHWFPKMQLAVRNDESGLWDFETLSTALPREPELVQKASFEEVCCQACPGVQGIIKSFVLVSSFNPKMLSGFPFSQISNYGLVVDAEKGLVVVSQATVPHDCCDITIVVADSIIVSGRVLFVHPLHNYSIVQYDPSLVSAPIESARMSSKRLKQGDTTAFFGFSNGQTPTFVAKTTVTGVSTGTVPAAKTIRFRAICFEDIAADSSILRSCKSGAYLTENGKVQGLWLAYLVGSDEGIIEEYTCGLPITQIKPVVEQIRQGIIPDIRILGILPESIPMTQARLMGVSDYWMNGMDRVSIESPKLHQLFMVSKVYANNKETAIKRADIILTLNGKLVVNSEDLDALGEEVDALVVRNNEEMQIRIKTMPTAQFQPQRMLSFCGLLIQSPFQAVHQELDEVPSELYIVDCESGTPSAKYDTVYQGFIVSVNSVPTLDLDSFIRETLKIPDNTYFRMGQVSANKQNSMITLKKFTHYTPTVEFTKAPAHEAEKYASTGGWKWQVLDDHIMGVDSEMADSSGKDSGNEVIDQKKLVVCLRPRIESICSFDSLDL